MRYTATKLGIKLKMSNREVNTKLAELGLLKGTPGNWALTEKGKKYGEYDANYYGHGDRIIWDKEVAYMIGDPDAYMNWVNNYVRKDLGLAPMTWDHD